MSHESACKCFSNLLNYSCGPRKLRKVERRITFWEQYIFRTLDFFDYFFVVVLVGRWHVPIVIQQRKPQNNALGDTRIFRYEANY